VLRAVPPLPKRASHHMGRRNCLLRYDASTGRLAGTYANLTAATNVAAASGWPKDLHSAMGNPDKASFCNSLWLVLAPEETVAARGALLALGGIDAACTGWQSPAPQDSAEVLCYDTAAAAAVSGTAAQLVSQRLSADALIAELEAIAEANPDELLDGFGKPDFSMKVWDAPDDAELVAIVHIEQQRNPHRFGLWKRVFALCSEELTEGRKDTSLSSRWQRQLQEKHGDRWGQGPGVRTTVPEPLSDSDVAVIAAAVAAAAAASSEVVSSSSSSGSMPVAMAAELSDDDDAMDVVPALLAAVAAAVAVTAIVIATVIVTATAWAVVAAAVVAVLARVKGRVTIS
jgi:hypothetical protein